MVLLSAVIKGLSEGTTYYIRSYAINRAGISYGEVRSFTTISYRLPVVNSPYIQDVSHDMVVCGGARIVDDNTDNIISKGICWSTSRNPTVNDSKVEVGGGNAHAIFCGSSDVDRVKPYEKNKKHGFSVRCVKD